jgi:hypothetical protein
MGLVAFALLLRVHAAEGQSNCSAITGDPLDCDRSGRARLPKDQYPTPTLDCGPSNPVIAGIIKDFNSLTNADLTPACVQHDLCYLACGLNKDFCDKQFYDQASDICSQRYFGPYNADDRHWCMQIAHLNYAFVHNPFTKAAWDFDQRLACNCCDCGSRTQCNPDTEQCCVYTGGKPPGCESKTQAPCGPCQFPCPGNMCCASAAFNTCLRPDNMTVKCFYKGP